MIPRPKIEDNTPSADIQEQILRETTDVLSVSPTERRSKSQIDKTLTPSELQFIARYLLYMDVEKAAEGLFRGGEIRVLFRSKRIQNAIATCIANRNSRMEIKQDEILQRIIEVADVDPALAFNENDNTVLPIHSIPPAVRRTISSYKMTATGLEVRFYDKLRALELLGKHTGALKETVNVRVSYEQLVAGSIVDGESHVLENSTDREGGEDTTEANGDRSSAGVPGPSGHSEGTNIQGNEQTAPTS